MPFKILLSNLGYLRGINGCLTHHLFYAHRHIYCSEKVQRRAAMQLLEMMDREDPDLCCFVEIDQGDRTSGNYHQLKALAGEKYPFFDIENKYASTSKLRQFALTRGKSNGFLAKQQHEFSKLYFVNGTKRLVYRISLSDDLTVFFAHFSLKKVVRQLQLMEIRKLLADTQGHKILLGDFNILTGLGELEPLLADGELVLLNSPDIPTFTFHTQRKLLDLCLCSPEIAAKADIKVMPQPFSDHAALLVTLG